MALALSACGRHAEKSGAGAKEIAVGAGQACARMADGAIYCWGSNRLGSVGVKGRGPEEQYHRVPVRVGDFKATRLLLVGVKSCFEKAEGGLYCWGGALSNENANPVAFLLDARGTLAASEGTGCVVNAEGRATCWGENTSGRLSPGDDAAVKELFGKETPPSALGLEKPVSEVAVGGRHACALYRDKSVDCWGLNNFGQLGNGDDEHERAVPRSVAGLDDVDALGSGAFHSCALKHDGSVWCWGRNDDGQLGTGAPAPDESLERRHESHPKRVQELPEAKSLSVGSTTTCAITKSDEVWCWGNNDHGQVGDGSATDRPMPGKVKLDAVTAVALGYSVSCALTRPGDVYCWGENDDGALGNGGIESSAVPTRVKLGPEAGLGEKPAEPVVYESLACGFRVKAPGKRSFREVSDLGIDEIYVANGDVRFVANCVKKSDMAEKDADALEAKLREAKTGDPIARKKLGETPCVVFSGSEGGSLTCYTNDLAVDISIRSKDTALVKRTVESVELFDPNAPMKSEAAKKGAPDGMVAIGAGEFPMGCVNVSLFKSPVGELSCTSESQPLHRVALHEFAIDKTEVSFGQYKACVDAGACTHAGYQWFQKPEEHPRWPVRNVTWEQARAYCAFKAKRLPTEAEWERAARGSDRRSRPWGDERATPERAALAPGSGVEPSDVGTHPQGASPEGAQDLVGNVKEWVADGFERGYYLDSPSKNPPGPASAILRTIRGSSYKTFAGMEAVTHRYGREPTFKDDDLGFRCALSDDDASSKASCKCELASSGSGRGGCVGFGAALSLFVLRRSRQSVRSVQPSAGRSRSGGGFLARAASIAFSK